MTDIPVGFTRKAPVLSRRDALSGLSATRIKSITKATIQGYIESFFSASGVNRHIYESLNGDITFLTDQSFETNQDTTKKQLQIARLVQDVRQQLPCILIIDAGMNYTPSGIFPVDGVNMTGQPFNGGKWRGRFPIIRTIPLTVMVAANDEPTTDYLHSVLSWMFGELRHLAGGTEIRSNSPDDHWVITLPSMFTINSVSAQSITEDNRDKYYAGDISMEIRYEDYVLLEMDWQGALPDRPVIDQSASTLTPAIEAPLTLSLQRETPVSFAVSYFQPSQHIFTVDNPHIVSIDYDNFTMVPRRTGTFKLQILSKPRNTVPNTMLTPSILAEKQISVTW